MNVTLMIHDLRSGNYEFITKEQSKYQAKLFFDYPILRMKGCGAEIHYEEVDSCDDVRYKLHRSLDRLDRKDNLFVFVTDDKENAAQFKKDNTVRKIVVSSVDNIADILVGNTAEANKLSANTKMICRKIAQL